MSQKGLSPILIVLLIAAALGVGGYVLYSKLPKATTPPRLTVPLTPSPTSQAESTNSAETVNTEPSRSTNWKTYTNNIYGYQLKYPSNWTLLAPTSSVSEQTSLSEIRKDKNDYQSQNLSIQSSINVTRTNIDSDSIIGANSTPKPKIKEMNIGGGQAQVVETVSNGKYSTHIVIWYKNTFIEINWHTNDKADQQILSQILSTFKFTQ